MIYNIAMHMKTIALLGILVISLFSCNVVNNKKSELKDRVETVNVYVSSDTDTYMSWESDTPIECMLMKEACDSVYSKQSLDCITGFTYVKGHEYILKVEKTILSNPPADASSIRYRLLKIVDDKVRR